MEDNVSKLYNALIKKNYSTEDLGGSVEQFRQGMRDRIPLSPPTEILIYFFRFYIKKLNIY